MSRIVSYLRLALWDWGFLLAVPASSTLIRRGSVRHTGCCDSSKSATGINHTSVDVWENWQLTPRDSSSCIVTTVIVWVELCLGAAFMVLLNIEYYRFAGVLEWIISYLGVAWLFTFVGYVA